MTATHVSSGPVSWTAAEDGRTTLFAPQRWLQVRLGLDLLVLYLAGLAAVLASPGPPPDRLSVILGLVYPLMITGILRTRRSPDTRLNGSLLDSVMYALGAVSLSSMLTIALGSVLDAHANGLVLRLWLFSAVYLPLSRAVLLSARRYAMRTGAYAVRTVVVGAGVVGTQLVERLLNEPGYGLKPVGFIDADPLRGTELDRLLVPVLGGPDELAEAATLARASRVILAFSSEPDRALVSKVRECQELGIDVSLVPRLYESINERASVDHVGGMPLLTLDAVNPRGWQFTVKHVLDRALALLTIVCAAPLLVGCAIAVRVSSPGPILFRQRRVGRDGQVFDLLKFRTMIDAGPAGQLPFIPRYGSAPGGVEGLDRRTRVGRLLRDLSLDELPQLFNVLRGKMSIVGPRPERPEYVESFLRDIARYGDRHRVKSGITGWAQVHGLRGQTSITDRVEWDNYYIRNWSLELDAKIMIMTIAEVLRLRDGRPDSERPSPVPPLS